MKQIARRAVKASLLGGVLIGSLSFVAMDKVVAAKPGRGGGSGCPRQGIYCLDVWDPVICSDGNVYSNGCYAYVACATGCVPYGGEAE
jgi:hypothetical protein